MLASKWFTAYAILFFAACFAYFLYTHATVKQALAPSILRGCFTSSRDVDNACLLKSADALLATYQTSELMHYIAASTSPDLVKFNCHSIAHAIGEETFKHSSNMEAALARCTNQCNEGCFHGVIVASVMQSIGAKSADDLAHAGIADITRAGAQYCAKSLNACHAIGHIAYANLADLPQSLSLCNTIASSTGASSCYLGVYMEAFQNSFASTSDMVVDEAHARDLTYPCDVISAKYQHACFNYLPLAKRQMRLMNNTTYPQRVAMWHKACASLPNAKMRSDCFMGFGMRFEEFIDKDGNLRGNFGTQCNRLSGTDRDSCIIGVSMDYAFYDRSQNALLYCSRLDNKHEKTTCYDAAFQALAQFSHTDAAMESKCDGLASKAECRDAFAQYIQVAATLPQYYSEGLF